MARTIDTDLHGEFEFYLANQSKFVAEYNGRVIAIKNRTVIGAFKSYEEAFREVSKEHEEGTFLLQRVSEGNKDYTATFHSRVAF